MQISFLIFYFNWSLKANLASSQIKINVNNICHLSITLTFLIVFLIMDSNKSIGNLNQYLVLYDSSYKSPLYISNHLVLSNACCKDSYTTGYNLNNASSRATTLSPSRKCLTKIRTENWKIQQNIKMSSNSVNDRIFWQIHILLMFIA